MLVVSEVITLALKDRHVGTVGQKPSASVTSSSSSSSFSSWLCSDRETESATQPQQTVAPDSALIAGRYSRSDKEKWRAPSDLPTKKPPVRIPANQDNTELIEANKLSLIGRLTNTTVQKPRAVIDFMTQVWNLEGRISGRALGLDKFQISFSSEFELLQVLDKRPYHYKRWMLILQHWEPVVSDQFPSTISFPVRIHGIPLHYWYESTILTIGKELGNCSLKDEKEAKLWVEVNGMEPLTMKMEIELPSGEFTEVEFEYIKIEKHCFTCFSLLHEEIDSTARPRNILPPKERALGITQRIALQRIEAEKKRHDDRRGYRRPDSYRSATGNEQGYPSDYSKRNAGDRSLNPRHEEHSRDRSILSRTARTSAAYHRNQTPSMQYRVVEKSRFSAGSSANLSRHANPQEGHGHTGIIPNVPLDRSETQHSRLEITPSRTIKDRLGVIHTANENSNSGSKEKRPALERLSEPRLIVDSPIRVSPTFESGRLQIPVNNTELVNNDEPGVQEIHGQSTDRPPAMQRLGDNVADTSRGRTIPIDPQSKMAGKRRITKAQARKRSPLQGLNLRKPSLSSTSTRRKLVVDNDKALPCDKAGTSSRRKNGAPSTVFTPGITRGGADFRPLQKSLP
ncbi:hypothetical protein Bca4012_055184 [Brassica carinata]